MQADVIIASWIIISGIFLGLYFAGTRWLTGGQVTRSRRRAFIVVLLVLWIGGSMLLALERYGWQPNRWELYGVVIVLGAVLYGVRWLLRRWEARW